MEDIYKEEDFYQDEGGPTESFIYCRYIFYTGEKTEYGLDYDQFALVENAEYPYIRLTKKREKSHFPCGGSAQPATGGWFASLTEGERDEQCPKIAWGFAALYLANLRYDDGQQDYVELRDRNGLIKEYYNKYLKIYFDSHNGLKFSKISTEQKELNFLAEHKIVIRELWEKSTPLKKYAQLFGYSEEAERDYEEYLKERKNVLLNNKRDIVKEEKNDGGRSVIQNGEKSIYVENNTGTIIIGSNRSDMTKNICFSTKLGKTFDTEYVKVFFLDDSVASKAQEAVSSLNCVKKVNITEYNGTAHPGQSLTVYPKSMVAADFCEKEIVSALNAFFAHVTIGKMQGHNEAYFAGIEKRILEALDKARATIDVCVAWFTNEILRDKLLEKQKEGIAVRVIRYHDGVNASKGVDLSELKHKEVRGERGGLFHDKFCVIDNVHIICGSYNWTLNAENKNDEDAAFHFEDYKLASTYTRRFNEIWRRGESIEP
jgi:hypothetical protein